MAEKKGLKVVEKISKPESPEKPEDLWYGFVLEKK